MRAPWLLIAGLALCQGQEIALGVFGEMTSWLSGHMAVIAAFDLDLRKNFESALAARLGTPIIQIPQLHPQVQNVTVRIGTSHSMPTVGVGTALDFIYGMDGETPVAALIGGSMSSVSMPVASIAAVAKIPQVSYSATSPRLSDKDEYPYFLRTVPPDSIQGKAFWQWIVSFQVPKAVCIYGVEPYGQGLYLSIKEQAILAGESSRLSGVGLRDMPVNFIEDEARQAVQLAKAAGTRFVLISTNSGARQLLPVMQTEGMLGTGWQLIASEALDNGQSVPYGMMKWNPVSAGRKHPEFLELWSKLLVDDVISAEAQARYKIDKFRVPLSESIVPPITDADFVEGNVPSYHSFLFDACYTFIVAINELLNAGTPAEEIKHELLLEQVKRTSFEGISGQVSFDANGDRQASYELLNYEPSGWRVAGTFNAATDALTLAGGLLWMSGDISQQPPVRFTECSPGFYKDESLVCVACREGFYCPDGRAHEPCARGSFANTTGSKQCMACPAGRVASDVGSSACGPCVPGFFTDAVGQEACRKCGKGSYTPEWGSTRCSPCGLGQVTQESGSESASDCQCAEGFFFCNSTGCRTCPVGLECAAGLGPPVQVAGYWTDSESCDFRVLRCRTAFECGVQLGTCAPGREGVACNNCKENHYARDDGSCALCGATDYLPSLLSGLALLVITGASVRCLKLDLNQQSLNLLTVAAVGGQLVTALQTLGSVRQLAINWVAPVRYLMELTQILAFDLDLIKISCFFGRDDPTLKFAGKLLVCPVILGCVAVAWRLSSLSGRKLSLDGLFNLSGIVIFALFISLSLAVLDPLRCHGNPDGSHSMVSSPGIICFNSTEHTGLLILCSLGILCYPVAVLTWTTYTVLQYPSRVNSGLGLRLVHRHRFLFQRFTPERYYYGAVLLYRNALVALFPVIFMALPELQMELMGAILLASGALQMRWFPWRTRLANVTDLAISSILQVVLLGVAPMLKVDLRESTKVLGWALTFAVLSPFVAGLVAIIWSLYRHARPAAVYGIFLCHHKKGAGSLCRLMKLLIAKHSSSEVFLDSDQLEDLDLIFDTIRQKTKSVVVVLTSELLQRMWCSGEVVTAFKNRVQTVPLICDGFRQAELDREIGSYWTPQQKQILAFHGISMEDVKAAYTWLRDLQAIEIARFGSALALERKVVEVLGRVKVPFKLFRPNLKEPEKIKARVLITGAVNDAEALATLEVFRNLVFRCLRKECAVVRSARELLSHKPWAYYFVVLFSRGILRDPSFARTLLSVYVEHNRKDRQLEMVTVNADVDFEFPSPEFLAELEHHGLGDLGPDMGEHLCKAYRALLNVLALPFSPMGSAGLLELQVSEICLRFKRYKNSVFATALDDEEDQGLGDGVDPEELLDDEGIFEEPEVRSSMRRVGKSIYWTEAGAMVDIDITEKEEDSDLGSPGNVLISEDLDGGGRLIRESF